ncbi:MAG TPA: ABC transporter permease [Acidobacteriaceae bacterium]|nr:ABC transporter permease [Acidobacteriaceae bacterium]
MNLWDQDIRFAMRQLRKSPAFAITAVVTLGLGIGVCAAMFSVIEQVILRPLPYANQNRLVTLDRLPRSGGNALNSFSWPDLRDYAARSHSIAGIAAFTFQLPTLGGTDNPQLVPELMVTPNLFQVLGIHTRLGRGFNPVDNRTGHTSVLILSDTVWKKFFRGDPSIIGRTVPIDGDPFTVIGVLPPHIAFPMGVGGEEILSPLNLDDKSFQDRNNAMLQPIALLRPGVTAAQAQREVNDVHAQLMHDYPKDEDATTIRLVDYHTSITQHSRGALFALDWAVLAVWLIACANVAGLILTRTNGRRREIAIRGALGAQRGRITQQFLTESLLIALAGSVLGLGIAALALHFLRRYLSDKVLFGQDIHINLGVLAFLLAAACLSALLFGLAPAWHASGVPAQEGLREGTAAAGTSRRQAMWRDGLVVAEISLTLALLIAAGLMMRTLLSLRRANLGFVTGNVVTGSLYLPTHGMWWAFQGKPNSASLIQTFYDPLEQKLLRIPGVVAAGFTTVRPLEPNWDFDDSVKVKGHAAPAPGQAVHAQVRATTDGYLHALGIRLLAGRLFGDVDGPDAPIAIIVNRALVQAQFPHENPLGQQLEVGDKGKPRRWGTIVGVVSDVKQDTPGQRSLPELDINLEQLRPTDPFYSILATFHMDLAVRARMAPTLIENTIRHDVHDLSPETAVEDLEPMQQVVDDSLSDQTLAARLLGIFSLAALLIAVAGIYGLLAYSVSQRTRELGVRIALGAQRDDIVWLVLRHALILLGLGGGIGLIVAWVAGGLMRSYLYGARGWDAATILLVLLVLGSCGLAASYLPARRAAQVDPVEALRSE